MEFSAFMVHLSEVSAYVRAKRILAMAGRAFCREMEDGRWKMDNSRSPISDLRFAKSLLSPARSVIAALALSLLRSVSAGLAELRRFWALGFGRLLWGTKSVGFAWLFVMMTAATGWGQSNPTAQSLPFSVNFGTATFTALPAGVAAWNGVTGATSTQAAAESSAPTGNATITAATAAQTGGGVYGYAASSDGKLYIQTSGNTADGASQAAIAINTTGLTSIVLSYTVDVISAQPRTVGLVAQYRVGTSGSWTTISASSGSNPFSQAGGTTGLKTTVSATLPTAANNQSVVQIRWATWRGTQTGNSSGIAIDNISVSGTSAGSLSPPALTAAGSATVDSAFEVTFADDSAWRSAITSITVGGTTLATGAYSVTSGKITFTPSASTLLQSSGSKSIAVIATGYNNATVTQTIGVGAASKLAVTTQPAAPASNGAVLATQPAVTVQDQYGNTVTGSSASITAAKGDAGTWTLGGTTSVNASSGVATFSGLTATSAAAVSNATITFTSGSLTLATSSSFNIPAPAPANDLSSNPTAITVNGSALSGTTVAATASSPFTGDPDVWYTFTAPSSGTITISTSSTSQDLDLYVWNSAGWGSGVPSSSTGFIASGATSSSLVSESVNFTATSGTTYYVRVLFYSATSSSTRGSFNISATTPTITGAATASAFTTTYGTASTAQSFAVSGAGLTANIVATAQTGFEVATTQTGTYGTSVSFTQASGSASGTVWVRLTSTAAAASSYNGVTAVALTTTGGATANITTSTSGNSVTPKALSVTAPTIASKTYNASAAAGAVTVGTLSGFVGTQTVTATASAAAYPSANAGSYSNVVITYTLANGLNGGLASNYSLANGTATGTITAKALTVGAPTIASKVYDGTTTAGAVTVGSLSGFVGSETVTATGAAADYSSANVGSYSNVVVTYTLVDGTNGGLASNYSLANGTATGTVTAQNLSITANPVSKSYGTALSTPVSDSTNFASSGLVSGESISSVTISYTNGTATNAPVGIYTNAVVPSAPVGITTNNYSITYNSANLTVNAVAPGAPALTGITPGDGKLTVEFTPPASDGGAAITNYRYSIDGGSYAPFSPAQTSSPLLISGLTNGTEYTVLIQAENSAGAGAPSGSLQGTPTEASVPTITALPSTLTTALTNTYGTPSAPTSFQVSGAALTGDLTVAAPAGVEVSSVINSGFTNTLTLTAVSNNVSLTTLYARLTADAPVTNNYNGASILVSGGGASNKIVALAGSGNLVTPRVLTIGGLSASNRVYNATSTGTVSGTPRYEGQVNGESNAVTDLVTWSFADKNVGTNLLLSPSASFTPPNANYTVTQPTFSADIDQAPLILSNAVAESRPFAAGNTNVTITGALSGVQGSDVVGFTGTGTIGSADAGTDIPVAAAVVLTGADAGNYSLTQPTGLTVDITKASNDITFGPLANVTAGTTNLLTATASSGLLVTYTSSNTNVASISGSNVIAVAPGVTIITASQAGNSNVAAAEPVSRTLNVAAAGASNSFTGTYSFAGANGNTSSLVYNGTAIANLTPSALTKVGVTNSSSTDNSRASGWATGSTNGAATPGGTIDTNEYFEFSLSVGAGFILSNPTIDFGVGRSASGPRQFEWRSSIDNFASAIPVTTNNASLTKTAGNVLQTPDANSGYTGNTVALTTSGQTNITFRFYAYGAEDAGGTGGLQGSLTFSGSLSASPAPAITPSGTFPALITTYGTPSSSSSVLVSGGSLTSNITATAPSTNFQVSADGTNWANTATYTNSGGFASGSLFLRLNSNALAGTYSNQVVALTSGSASNSIAISNSTVNRYPITVGAVATNKVYGDADPALTYTNAPLLFSDTFSGSITRAPGNNAGTYAITRGTLTNANYEINFLTNTFTITPKALSITANNVTKIAGSALTTPQTGSAAFSSIGLATGESISSVTITYTNGASSGAPAGLYAGVVVPSDPVGINTNNYSITYNAGNLTVDASPTITVGTASLSAFSTTYGTDSTTQSFTVLGGSLPGSTLTVQAPAGFQVSTNASSGFAGSVVLDVVSNAVPLTTIYARVPGTNAVSTNLSGNIAVSSDSAATQIVSIPASTVSPKALTIGGLSATDRVYDATTNGTVTGTASFVGLVGSDTNFMPTNTVTWSFANKNVGTGKVLSPSADFTAPSANYTVTQPANTLSANITQATLTLSNAAATSRAYAAGNTNVTITGTLSGVFPGDTVGFNGTNAGTIASANVGTDIPVTANLSLTGADAGNYTLTQPTDLTVDITKASQTINFAALSNVVAGTTNALTATASSGLAVTYTSSNTNIATTSGSNVIAVAPGVTTITASQAGDGNYSPAAPVSQTLNVGSAFSSVTLLSENFNAMSTNSNLPPAFRISASSASPTWSAATTTVTQIITGTNTTVTGGTYNFGATTNERAVGAMSTGTFGSPSSLMAVVTNTSGSTLASVSVSFVAERFRVNTTAASVQLFASTNGSAWVAVTNGDISSASFPTGTSTWIWDTPTTVSRSNIAVTNFSVTNNGVLYLRWNIATGGSSSQAIAIDDVTVTTSVQFPTITSNGSFPAVSTIYGTASDAAASTVGVTGGSLTGAITATAPTGFEVSTNGSTWGSTATFTQTGGFADGSLFLRLASNAAAQTYSNQVVALTSGSASNSVAIANSTVNPKALTVTGIGSIIKVYNGSNNATFTGTLDGVVGSDAVTLNGTGTYASVNVGTNIAVTSTATLGGASAGNYSLSQPTGLSGSITAKAITGSFTVSNKIYDGSAAATVTGTSLSGVVVSDDVSLTGGTATFNNENAGTNKTVFLAGATLAGAASDNYMLSSVSNATANIVAKTLTITAEAKSKVYGAADPELTYTSSGLVGSDSIAGGLVRTAGESAGTYAINQGTLSAGSNYSISYTGANLTITAASLPAVTWSNGVISGAGGVASFSYEYTGRSSNGITTVYSNTIFPPQAGYYRAVATSTDGNYSGSSTNEFHVAGPVLANDTGASSYDLRKPQNNSMFFIDKAVVLANDKRIDSSGSVQTTGLDIASVAAVTGSISYSAPFILYTPTSAATDTFTYSVTADGVTATATVTVVPETNADVPTFDLQIVRIVSGPTYNGTNTTTVVDFIGVPNKTYEMYWSTNVSSTNWVSMGNQSTGGSGSFTVTNTVTGNRTSGFFRAKVNP